MSTTCKNAMEAVKSSLETDYAVLLQHPKSPELRRRIREIALENVRIWNTAPSSSSSGGLRIYTSVDVKAIGLPKPPSPTTRIRLREAARNIPTFPGPCALRLVPRVDEKSMALVPCSLTIGGIHGGVDDPIASFKEIDGIWDTGAYVSVIVEDLLPESFREYLKSSANDAYRDASGTRVQVSATLGFSNDAVQLEAIFLVVPKTVVPNERVGILFGQHTLIDRISHLVTPRAVLRAKGSEISDEYWGRIDIYEHYTMQGEMVKF
jgi:hypothetical protein